MDITPQADSKHVSEAPNTQIPFSQDVTSPGDTNRMYKMFIESMNQVPQIYSDSDKKWSDARIKSIVLSYRGRTKKIDPTSSHLRMRVQMLTQEKDDRHPIMKPRIKRQDSLVGNEKKILSDVKSEFSDNQALREEINRLKNELSVLKAQTLNLSTRPQSNSYGVVDSPTFENESLKNETLHAELQSKNQTILELKSDLEKANDALSNLQLQHSKSKESASTVSSQQSHEETRMKSSDDLKKAESAKPKDSTIAAPGLEGLRLEISKLKEENTKLRDENADLKGEVAKAVEKSKESNSKHSSLIRTLKDRATKLQTELDDVRSQSKEDAEIIAKLTAEQLQTLEHNENMAQLEKTLIQMREEAQMRDNKLKMREEVIDELKTQLRSDHASASTQATSTQNAGNASDVALSEMRERLLQVQSKLSEQMDKNTTLSDERLDAINKLGIVKEQIASIREQNKSLVEKLEQMEKEATKQSEEFKETTDSMKIKHELQLKEQNEQILKFQSEIQELKESKKNLVEKLKQNEKKVKEKIQNSETEIQELKDSKEELKKTITSLRDEIFDKAKRNQALHDKLIKLTTGSTTLKESSVEVKKDEKVLELEEKVEFLAKVEGEFEAMNEKIKDQEIDLEEKMITIEELKAEIEELKDAKSVRGDSISSSDVNEGKMDGEYDVLMEQIKFQEEALEEKDLIISRLSDQLREIEDESGREQSRLRKRGSARGMKQMDRVVSYSDAPKLEEQESIDIDAVDPSDKPTLVKQRSLQSPRPEMVAIVEEEDEPDLNLEDLALYEKNFDDLIVELAEAEHALEEKDEIIKELTSKVEEQRTIDAIDQSGKPMLVKQRSLRSPRPETVALMEEEEEPDLNLEDISLYEKNFDDLIIELAEAEHALEEKDDIIKKLSSKIDTLEKQDTLQFTKGKSSRRSRRVTQYDNISQDAGELLKTIEVKEDTIKAKDAIIDDLREEVDLLKKEVSAISPREPKRRERMFSIDETPEEIEALLEKILAQEVTLQNKEKVISELSAKLETLNLQDSNAFENDSTSTLDSQKQREQAERIEELKKEVERLAPFEEQSELMLQQLEAHEQENLELEALFEQLKTQEENLEEKEQIIQRLSDNVDVLSKTCNGDKMAQSLVESSREISRLGAKVKRLESYKPEFESMRRELQEKEAERRNMAQQFDSIMTEIQEEKERTKEMHLNIVTDYENEIDDLKAQVERLSDFENKQIAPISAYEKDIKKMRVKIREQKKLLKEKQQLISELSLRKDNKIEEVDSGLDIVSIGMESEDSPVALGMQDNDEQYLHLLESQQNEIQHLRDEVARLRFDKGTNSESIVIEEESMKRLCISSLQAFEDIFPGNVTKERDALPKQSMDIRALKIEVEDEYKQENFDDIENSIHEFFASSQSTSSESVDRTENVDLGDVHQEIFETMKAKIESQEAEMEQLKKEIEHLAEIAVDDAIRNEVVRRLDTQDKLLLERKNTIDSLHRQIADNRRTSKTEKDELMKKFEWELMQKSEELETLQRDRAENRKFDEQIDLLKSELKEQSTILNAKQAEITTLQETIAELTQFQRDDSSESSNLREEVDEMRGRLNEQEFKLRRKASEVKELKTQIHSEKEKMEKQISAHQREAQKLKDEIVKLSGGRKKDKENEVIRGLRVQIQEQTSALKKAEKEIDNLNSEIVELSLFENGKSAQISKMEARVVHLESQIREKELSIQELNSQIAYQLNAGDDSVVNDGMQSDSDSSSGFLISTYEVDELETVQKELELTSKTLHNKNQYIKELEDEIDELHAKASEVASNGEYLKQIKFLKQENKAQEAEIELLRKAIKAYEEKSERPAVRSDTLDSKASEESSDGKYLKQITFLKQENKMQEAEIGLLRKAIKVYEENSERSAVRSDALDAKASEESSDEEYLKQITLLKEETKMQEAEIGLLRKAVKAYEEKSERPAVRSDNDGLADMKEQFYAIVDEKDDEIAQLHEDLDSLKDQGGELVIALEEAMEALREKDIEMEDLAKQIQKREEKMKVMDQEIEVLQKKSQYMPQLKEKIKLLERKMRSRDPNLKKLADKDKKIAELEKKVTEMSAYERTFQKEMDLKLSQIIEKDQQVSELKVRLGRLQDKFNAHDNKIATLEHKEKHMANMERQMTKISENHKQMFDEQMNSAMVDLDLRDSYIKSLETKGIKMQKVVDDLSHGIALVSENTEHELNTLRQENDSLKTEIQKMKDDKNDEAQFNETVIQNSLDQLSQAQDRNKLLNANVSTALREIESLQKENTSLKAKITHVLGNSEKLINEVESMSVENSSLKETVGKVRKKVKVLEDEKESLNRKVSRASKMARDRSQLSSELEVASTENQKLQEKVAESVQAAKENDELKRQLKASDDENSKLVGKIKRLEKEVRLQRNEKETLEASVARAAEESMEQRRSESVAKNEYRKLQTEVESMLAENKRLEDEKEALQRKLSRASKMAKDRSQLSSELQMASTENQKLQEQVAESLQAAKENDGLKRQLKASDDENSKLLGKTKQLQKEVRRQRNEKETLEANIAKATAESMEQRRTESVAKSEYKRLQTQNQKMRKTILELQEREEGYQDAETKAKGEILENQIQISGLMDEVGECRVRAEKAEDAFQKIKIEMATLRGKQSGLENKVKVLRSKKEKAENALRDVTKERNNLRKKTDSEAVLLKRQYKEDKKFVYERLQTELKKIDNLRNLIDATRKQQMKFQDSIDSEYVHIKSTLASIMHKHQEVDNSPNLPIGESTEHPKAGHRFPIVARIRPTLVEEDGRILVEVSGENQISVSGADATRYFDFDRVFGPSASQQEVSPDVQDLIKAWLKGRDVALLAFGTSGSGKNYTMVGEEGSSGILRRVMAEVFMELNHGRKRGEKRRTVNMAVFEIQNEKVRDLLAQNGNQYCKVNVTSSRTTVKDLVEAEVGSLGDILDFLDCACVRRRKPKRSHLLIQIKLSSHRQGRLFFVILAGAENKRDIGLIAVRSCIRAMKQNSKSIPYSKSTLTQILSTAISRRGRSLMFVNISPIENEVQNTMQALKFIHVGRIVAHRKVEKRRKLRNQEKLIDVQESEPGSFRSSEKIKMRDERRSRRRKRIDIKNPPSKRSASILKSAKSEILSRSRKTSVDTDDPNSRSRSRGRRKFSADQSKHHIPGLRYKRQTAV